MNEIKKNSMPKWLQIGILIVGVGLIAVGISTIFGGSSPNAFVDQFNELQAPFVEVKDDLTNVSSLLNEISAKETNKDYAGITSNLQIALAKLNNAEVNIEATQTTLVEFQRLVDSSSDQNVKTAGSRFIEVFKSRNVAGLKMIADSKDLVNQATIYYNEVANEQKVTIDENRFGAMASSVVADAESLTNIGVQYDTAAKDFAKAAGFTIAEK